MPEVPSDPENATESPWLYQPFASGPRSGAADTEGGEASRRTMSVTPDVSPEVLCHVHPTGVPPVSLEIVTELQPLATVTPAGGELQLTVTFDVCQAEQSAGPGEHPPVGWGGGAVAAAPASVRPATARTRSRVGSRRAFTPSPTAHWFSSGDAACCRWRAQAL